MRVVSWSVLTVGLSCFVSPTTKIYGRYWMGLEGEFSMDSERFDPHAHASEVLKHPLNRDFLKQVIDALNPGGNYLWTDVGEVFTRDELVKLLAEAKKETP